MFVSKALVYRFVVSMLEDASQQQQLLDELGVHPEASQHPLDDRVPVSALNRAHHRLAEITGDEFVSWRFGFLFELDSLGVLGVLWRHASCLEDMLSLHVKFLAVLMDVVTAELVSVPGGKKIEWSPLPDWESQDALAVQREHEAAIGFFSKAIQVMTGEALMPLAIQMKRSQPDAFPNSYAPYLELTDFNAEKHSISFYEDDLSKPLVSFNPHLLNPVEQYLETVLQTLNQRRGFAADVERLIIREFPAQILTVEQAASQFHMSTRNFQRKLVESGESYRELLNRVRLSIAKQQLQNKELSVGEIGFLLGYTEPPAFIRFFKKQSGISPSEYRQHHP